MGQQNTQNYPFNPNHVRRFRMTKSKRTVPKRSKAKPKTKKSWSKSPRMRR